MKGQGILTDPVNGDVSINVVRDRTGMIARGFAIGKIERQNQGAIICMHQGEVKEWPTVGVGLPSMLLSDDTLLYKHRIREQLEADGFLITYMNILTNEIDKIEIQLDASYHK